MTHIPRPSFALGLAVAITLVTLASFAHTTAQAPTETPIARYMMDVYADGRVVLSTLTPTPWPTFTPQETPTSEPTPTLTPSSTPIPTHTPTATATTPPSSATPTEIATQETALPPTQPTMTSTPSPTATPTITPPPDRKCWGTVFNTKGDHLLIRDKPWGNVLGGIPEGDTLTLEAFWIDGNDDKWYEHYWLPGKVGYSHSDYIAVSPEADCSQLPDRTPHTVRVGAHMLAGEGGSAPIQYGIDTGKVLPGSLHLGPQLKAINPDAWIVCRLFTDSIFLDNDYDADVVWELIHRSIPDWCDAFELENEHTPGNLDQWSRWSKANIDFAARLAYYKNMQYLAYSYGPGWPEYHETIYMVEYLEWVALNPLSDGRYHGVASHAAVYAPWGRPDMPWVNSEHIAGRIYKQADYLLEHTGFDLRSWPGEWALTEIGLSDGYASGIAGVPYTCAEAASALHYTVIVHTEGGIITAIHWWSFGEIGMWTSDHDCAALMYG